MEGAAPDLLDLLTQQLGLAAAPEAVAEWEANGLTWALYAQDVQGLKIDFALAEGQGRAYLVLLQSSTREHDALYNGVFLRAIDGLKPIR